MSEIKLLQYINYRRAVNIKSRGDKMTVKGRPTKYKKEFCIQAEKLCRKGFIDTEIADFFEVNVDTIYEWKKRHSEFSDALKSGKRYSDDAVVSALYNRALGYEVTEVKNEEGSQGNKVVSHKKHIAGDTTAQIFWLKNRQPEQWRDKQHVDVALTDDFDSLLDDAND